MVHFYGNKLYHQQCDFKETNNTWWYYWLIQTPSYTCVMLGIYLQNWPNIKTFTLHAPPDWHYTENICVGIHNQECISVCVAGSWCYIHSALIYIKHFIYWFDMCKTLTMSYISNTKVSYVIHRKQRSYLWQTSLTKVRFVIHIQQSPCELHTYLLWSDCSYISNTKVISLINI